MKYLFMAMRPHQWTKGVFILLPLVFGQKLTDHTSLYRTGVIFFAYALISSGIYILNDILDVEEDRHHPEKKKRPLAAGKITVKQAYITAFLLIGSMLPISFVIDIRAGFVLLVYLFLNYFYMRYLKHAVIIDVFCIGAFFYLRILAGGIACGVVLSNWIIMCTVLLALFIGFNKRRYDLEFSKETRPVFTKYNSYFVDRMISVISTSLIISYTFYVMDENTIQRFGSNNLIYSVPFVYYGVFRYLYLMDTKWYGGDPARLLIRDYKLQLTLFLWLLVCTFVIYFKI